MQYILFLWLKKMKIKYFLVKPTKKKLWNFIFSVCRLLWLGKVFFLLTISYFLTDYRHIKSDIYDFLIQIYAKRWAIFTAFSCKVDSSHTWKGPPIFLFFSSSHSSSALWHFFSSFFCMQMDVWLLDYVWFVLVVRDPFLS